MPGLENEISKLAIVHNKIREYRTPIFKQLEEIYNVDFYIFEKSDDEPPLDVVGKNSADIFRGVVSNDYDVVLLPDYLFKEAWIGAIAGTISRTPVVTWSEIWDMPHTPIPIRFIKRLLAFGMGSLSDSFVVPGEKARRYLSSTPVVQEESIFKSPNAHNLSKGNCPSAVAEKYKITNDGKTILYLGQLIERKRVQDVISSIQHLKVNFDITLLIAGVGDEEYTDYLKQIADDVVRFLGWVQEAEIYALYDLADVYVLPSLRDPYPLTVVEAMSVGTPVIISEGVGQAGDLVRQGVTGEIVPTKSPENIATALERMLSTESYQSTVAKKAKMIVNEEISYTKMIDGINKALEFAYE